jgi:hypothetical protein
MSKLALKACRVAGVLSILCVGAAPLSAAGAGVDASFPSAFAPNPGVGWITRSTAFMPPLSGAGPVVQDPAHPHVSNEEFRDTGRQPTFPMADLSSPILQPWTREELRKRNQLVLAGQGGLSRAANCWPVGVPAFALLAIQPIFFIPGPKEVVMVWQGDHHQMRHVYLTDKHSARVAPSWFGESIGHYEGDTLLVDTIGVSTKTFIDDFFTPHTEKLHVVERFRVIDGGKGLEAAVHVEDPGAFTMPWDGIQRYRRVEPGTAENDTPLNPISGSTDAGPLIERSCAENPFNYFGGAGDTPVPHADRADF